MSKHAMNCFYCWALYFSFSFLHSISHHVNLKLIITSKFTAFVWEIMAKNWRAQKLRDLFQSFKRRKLEISNLFLEIVVIIQRVSHRRKGVVGKILRGIQVQSYVVFVYNQKITLTIPTICQSDVFIKNYAYLDTMPLYLLYIKIFCEI